jgi:hypothetical protein
MRGLTVYIAIGQYGGFYVNTNFGLRICLGHVAINIMPTDIEKLLMHMMVKAEGVGK